MQEATFQIIGNVARIDETEALTRVSIASNTRRRTKDGWEDQVQWNEVKVFGAKQRIYLSEHIGKGDQVHIQGKVQQNSYETTDNHTGQVQTQYTVDLIASKIGRLSRKNED